MAMDMFLSLDGIKGESRDHKHKDTIQVLAWSWGMSNSGSAHHGSGAGSGKANFQDLSLTHYIDKASAALMMHCATGKHIKKGQLIVRKAGDKPLEYLKIDMEDILISSVSTGGSGGEDRLTENVSLNFAVVKMAYQAQKADGSGEPGGEFGYNIPGNVKV